MNASQAASILGKKANGVKKTMTPAAIKARSNNWAKGRHNKALKHEDRKSFKKWGKPSRTMTDTKAAIEKRKAASKSFRVGRNNTKGDPFQLSNHNAKDK